MKAKYILYPVLDTNSTILTSKNVAGIWTIIDARLV